jgi:DNA glycosylase AlkZ-like
MTSREVARARLVSQQIATPSSTSPAELVAAMGAMQAQDYRAALWAVGVRLPGTAEAAVERAIAERSIVRTWPMRGTLHFVAAADVRWMLELLTPRSMAAAAGRHRQLGLDGRVFARSRELLTGALKGGRRLTRGAAREVLEQGGVSTAGQRGIHILGRLAQEGLLCLGPYEGRQQTFVLLGEWVPPGRRLARDEALAELAGRYFASHGPATVHDFAWWSGLKVADARAGLRAVQARLRHVSRKGVDYWMAVDVAHAPGSAATVPALPGFTRAGRRSPTVYLLPAYDEYLIGYRDRSAMLDPRHDGSAPPSENGLFRPIVVVDGRVAGLWRRELTKHGVRVQTRPFVPLTAAPERAARVEAARYAAFLGVDLID